jgi:hypothetical protein
MSRGGPEIIRRARAFIPAPPKNYLLGAGWLDVPLDEDPLSLEVDVPLEPRIDSSNLIRERAPAAWLCVTNPFL